jgi:hypothetical protein
MELAAEGLEPEIELPKRDERRQEALRYGRERIWQRE